MGLSTEPSVDADMTARDPSMTAIGAAMAIREPRTQFGSNVDLPTVNVR